MMDEEKKVTGRKNILLSAAAVLILCILLFPLYWALITSLKTEQEIFRNPPTVYNDFLAFSLLHNSCCYRSGSGVRTDL